MGLQPCFLTIRRLADYEVWCNRRIIDAAEKLTREQLFHRFEFGFGTIHATLFHVIEVMQTWSGCIAPTISKHPMVPYDPAMSLEQLAIWNMETSDAFLNAIDNSTSAGLLDQDRRLVQLFHLVTHGTHHRTQVIAMLRLLSIDPPFEAGDFAGWERRGGCA